MMIGSPTTRFEDAGAAAPQDDPYLYFDQENKRRGKPDRPEEEAAEWLRKGGIPVRSVNERHAALQQHGRTIPDGLLDSIRRTVEVKVPAVASVRAIRDRIYGARGQSPYVVIDLRRSGASEDTAREALKREIGRSGDRFIQIIVIVRDDLHLEWRHA